MADGSKQPKNDKPTAASVADIPDLLREILVRLPARSLMRFQCVSKHWLSLISNPHFQSNHTLLRKDRDVVCGLYFDPGFCHRYHAASLTGSAARIPSLNFLGSKIRVISYCKGLLLCLNDDRDCYVVCNPTTKKYSSIPIPQEIRDWRHMTSLACDPLKSPVFKVVGLCLRDEFRLHIYSSDTCSWKPSMVNKEAPMKVQYCEVYSRSVFFSGSLYWLVYNGYILRFGMGSEELVAVQVPIVRQDIKYFGECKGSLVIVAPSLMTNNDYRLKIYEMDSRNCGHWSSKCCIQLSPTLDLSVLKVAPVLCVSKMSSSTGGDYELVIAIPGQVVSYSMEMKKLKVISHTATIPLERFPVYCYFYAYPFVETLAPV